MKAAIDKYQRKLKVKLLACTGNERGFNYDRGRYSEMFSIWHLNNLWNFLFKDVVQVKNLAKYRARFMHLVMNGNF